MVALRLILSPAAWTYGGHFLVAQFAKDAPPDASNHRNHCYQQQNFADKRRCIAHTNVNGSALEFLRSNGVNPIRSSRRCD